MRRSFAQQAGLFAGDNSPFARRAPSPLAWLEPLDPAMIVLDVACGAGHVAELVAPHVRQVVGIDLTRPLLLLAADRIRDAGLANVLLQEGNAGQLPFLDASFDLVACRGSMHHFSRPDQQLTEMARVCRPGGRVVVSDMVAPSEDVRAAFDELHRLIDPSHAGVLLGTRLAELLHRIVGPLDRVETSLPFTLPVDQMLTDVANRASVMS
ncbi:MAG: hypothetical protein QOI55_2874, partial [Actinomycetota bacterium]|nr:hypothetical protein [Actinomycetota bacterium]